MRELERNDSSDTPACTRLAIVGRGRMGTALAAALGQRSPGSRSTGPLPRGADGQSADAVLLCVPDGQIAAAAEVIAPGPLVGHCSGATTLDPLAPHERFSLHPLMTVTSGAAELASRAPGPRSPAARRAPASSPTRLATALRMRPVEIADSDRAAYHAAASIASNFLVTLEAAAERLLATAGRRPYAARSRSSGPRSRTGRRSDRDSALTGPAARGDEATVARQRAAVTERAADLLPLFDTLTQATRALAMTKARAA